jgi:hypothetical protein
MSDVSEQVPACNALHGFTVARNIGGQSNETMKLFPQSCEDLREKATKPGEN